MSNNSSFRENFLAGLKDGLPICLGYLAVSFAFGIQAVESGLTVFEATMISLLNVTSAGQFAGIGIIAANGSFLEIAASQLIINLRYSLMSVAISQKIDPKLPTLKRLGIAFGMTDEIFAVSAARPGVLQPSFSLGAISISVAGWVLGTFLGAYAGQILPDRVISALGLALYGMFLAIIIPPARDSRPVLYVVLLAMFLSVLFTYAPYLRLISSGFRIIIVTLLSAGLFATISNKDSGES
ncbi:MAG: AzlC family ABC transporter permease [Lachnospiraceae bacterium]|nr:AzlC family ABC transporter permease [Lachnospiraceae bacterium]